MSLLCTQMQWERLERDRLLGLSGLDADVFCLAFPKAKYSVRIFRIKGKRATLVRLPRTLDTEEVSRWESL